MQAIEVTARRTGMLVVLAATGYVVGDQKCELSWEALTGSAGVNGFIQCLATLQDDDGTAVYAGGWFTAAGGKPASRVARWDGESWSNLGNGLSGTNAVVYALAEFDDGAGAAPYAGGSFTSRVAKWNGSTWQWLGTGVDGTVRALQVFDDGNGPALYVGGFFMTAGGMEANRIARWDGAGWKALGSGLNGPVYAMKVFDDGSGPALYVGGQFSKAGGADSSNLARWNGTEWSVVEGAPNGAVVAMGKWTTSVGTVLVVGGEFSEAGGLECSRIAHWNGSQWSSLGSGIDTIVYEVAEFDDRLDENPALYAAGFFETAGGQPAANIARWNGQQWSAVGDGMNSWVGGLATMEGVTGPVLYAGGQFTQVGGQSAERFARLFACKSDSTTADLDGNGIVNVFDLLILLAAWGPCDDCEDCPADLDDSCAVNVFDLLILLANWG